jgi:hypothetical protein
MLSSLRMLHEVEGHTVVRGLCGQHCRKTYDAGSKTFYTGSHNELKTPVWYTTRLKLLASRIYGFTTKNLYAPLLSPIRATYPAHLILLDFITRTILSEYCRSLSSSLCSFLYSPVTLSPLGSNILLNALFSNTLSLRSSPNVSDQDSYPYKTTGKIIVLYVLKYRPLWTHIILRKVAVSLSCLTFK